MKPVMIIPANRNDKDDREKAKILEKLFNYQFDKYEGVINALNRVKIVTETIYPNVRVDMRLLEKVVEEIIKLEIREK